MKTRTKFITMGVSLATMTLTGCNLEAIDQAATDSLSSNENVELATADNKPVNMPIPSMPNDNACGSGLWVWDEYRALWQCDDASSDYYKYYSYQNLLFKDIDELIYDDELGSEYIASLSGYLPPTSEHCSDFEWDEEQGVWVCDDESSGHYDNLYYSGAFYLGMAALLNSSNGASYSSGFSKYKSGAVAYRPAYTQNNKSNNMAKGTPSNRSNSIKSSGRSSGSSGGFGARGSSGG